MLILGGGGAEVRGGPWQEPRTLLRVSTNPNRIRPFRQQEAFLASTGEPPEGFAAYVCLARNASILAAGLPENVRVLILPDAYDYLSDGDVIRVEPARGRIRVLYRRSSPHNTFLTTERCNHYCLMCSQPPRDVDDSWLAGEILETLKLIDPATQEIGLSGGEPTLLGDDLIRIIRAARSLLPSTSLHILSNGRRFADPMFARSYAGVGHPDMMVGIPIYSDVSTIHDYVVQADGAFDETIRGILNLKQLGQKVEIRVVIHKQTYDRLPQLAEFIARNLTFVDQVALMGLEMTGFTRANLDLLWIDPIDYQSELTKAGILLSDHRMNVAIYNHQLCLLDRQLWPLARKSISDWKNEYMPECDGCTKRQECGGFFSSATLRYSDYIRPL